MEAQVFRPDDEYCAYCHAPAAGPCAECGALCCGECVEIVLRFTSRRAVCKSCLATRPRSATLGAWRWIAAGTAVLAGALALLYRIVG